MRKILNMLARTAAALAGTACLAAAVMAQPAFPSRPLKLIVPFPAGGSSDILARAFAEKLQAELGQPVVVDNRAGGNTVIGTQAAASAKPDGYTILQVTPNSVTVGSLRSNLPYDLERDFTPVLGVGAVPLMLVVPAMSNTRSIADLAAAAKTSPSGITYGSGGIGSLGHLVPARFVRDLGVTGTHVPYRGVAPAVQDVAAGRVQFMFVSSLEGMQMTKTGMVRVLAVTSGQRLPNLPKVPTMAELGFADFKPVVWYGFMVPAHTPPVITARLAKAFANAAGDPAMREHLMALGLSVEIRDATAFGKYLREETMRWTRVVRDNDIRME
ncbi:tripartite tricarboxylate transporter substrate binding protein [Variovorax paradoxus]|uniref:Bug family tripartite tricarboxylate transporter substrate binding protein n=1 Tax=Variovorax paradoxus TaxID=34073 RepID=UPI0021ABFA2A|nr:tripartite tricarboxylate transporter substrate binding protein [Variovorax paradoxus]UVH60572.1 tripartite tricarboxylate transporter substrate binding protein [Variovorax paradoxus]